MIKEVIKADGSVEPFDLEKLSKWAKYASEFAKLYTKDVGVMNDIDRLRNRRSLESDVE